MEDLDLGFRFMMNNFFSIQIHPFRYKNNSVEYLVLKRSENLKVFPGMWQVVTGTINDGEKAYSTALRELKEETGFDPQKCWHIPYIGQFYDYRSNQIYQVPIFAAEVNDQEVILSNEHTEYKWLNYEDCIDILDLPSHVEGLKFLKDYILHPNRNKWFRIDL